MGKAGTKLIRWNMDERAALVTRIIDIRKATGKGTLDALREAQNILPEDRRRSLKNSNDIPLRLIKELGDEISRRYEEKEQAKFRPLPAPPPATPETILINPFEQFLSEFITKLGDEFELRLTRVLNSSPAQVTAVPPSDQEREEVQEQPLPLVETAPTRRETRPQITIVGLLPIQKQEILSNFPELNLHFVDSGRPPSYHDFVHAAVTILLTKFVSHSYQETAKRYSRKLSWCNGGVSALSLLLMEYARKAL